MDVTDLTQRFDEVAAVFRADDQIVANERVRFLFGPAIDTGPVEVATAAIQLLESSDVAVRATAASVLAMACDVCETVRASAFAALLDRVDVDDDPAMCRCLARALGATANPSAVTPLIRLAEHEDARVREHVAASLPAVLLKSRDPRGVEALLRLTDDTDDDVRNWATFGIARQLDVDSTEIRAALAVRLWDSDLDVREEAIVGLAIRRDRRALPFVIELLRDAEPQSLAFQAAAHLGDSSLVPLLEQYPEAAGPALVQCDPIRRNQWHDTIADFHTALQERLDTRFLSATATTGCDLCETETWVRVEAITSGQWCLDNILARTDPTAAADRVIRQLIEIDIQP